MASGAGDAGWRIGANHSTATGNYAGVTEQSGIAAGASGFAVDVQGNTNLQGGFIASTAPSQANQFRTGSLTTQDLQNQSTASASSSGWSLSSDMLSQGKYGLAKGGLTNLADRGSAQGTSQGATRAAVSEGAVTITQDAEQQRRTGQSGVETVAVLNCDVQNAQKVAERQDPQALLRQAQAEQAIKNEAVRTLTTFTDPAYTVMFKRRPKFYWVDCPAGEECTKNPEQATSREITGSPQEVQSEIAKAPAGLVLTVNGIQNDLTRATQLAMQNAKPDDDGHKPTSIILMHYEPAGNAVSELMVAGYEKKLAGTLGYTNRDYAYADALEARGTDKTTSLGHSRGTIVQTNASEILAERGYTNPNLSVQGAGGAVSEQRFNEAATTTIGQTEKAQQQFNFAYYNNDPVSVIVGGNPGVISLSEFWQMLSTSNSAHSCYGTGAPGCRQVQYPVPNAPPGAVQDNFKLINSRPGTQ